MKRRTRRSDGARAVSGRALDQVGGGFWDWFGWGGEESAKLEGLVKRRQAIFDNPNSIFDNYGQTDPEWIGEIDR